MSKNFEEAYKAEVQQNIPDLWNRIESNLPEKKSVQNMAEVTNNVPVSREPVKKIKKKNPYAWIKWASLAAACLLVLLIAPAVIGVGLLGMVAKDESAADMAAPEIYYENAMMDMEYAEEEKFFENEIAAEVEENDTIVSELPAPSLMQQDGAQSVTGEESEYVTQEAAPEEELGEAMPQEAYGEPIVEGLYVEVIAVDAQEEYYEAVILFSDVSRLLADNMFEGNIFYDEGNLIVRVYPDKGEVPVAGEKYSVDVYNSVPETHSIVLPYTVELKSGATEQY